MPRTREQSRQSNSRRENELVPKMQILAELAGCQLRPSSHDQLRGYCPFHYSTSANNVRTLKVEARRGAFYCSFCHHQGSPAVFAATYWQVAVSEATLMLQAPDDQITLERPRSLAFSEDELSKPEFARAQNTYLLTKAAYYFSELLERTPPAQHYLYRLGIPHHAWTTLLLGYARGHGLQEHLTAQAAVTNVTAAQRAQKAVDYITNTTPPTKE